MKMKRMFTKWYVKCGYKFRHEGVELRWDCPTYVRPFLGLFSPSTYLVEKRYI